MQVLRAPLSVVVICLMLTNAPVDHPALSQSHELPPCGCSFRKVEACSGVQALKMQSNPAQHRGCNVFQIVRNGSKCTSGKYIAYHFLLTNNTNVSWWERDWEKGSSFLQTHDAVDSGNPKTAAKVLECCIGITSSIHCFSMLFPRERAQITTKLGPSWETMVKGWKGFNTDWW